MPGKFPTTRLRRLRYNSKVRDLVRETTLSVNDLIYPIFVDEKLDTKKPISSMPGQFQLSVNDLEAELSEIQTLKIPAILLFAIPKHRDATGSDALKADGFTARVIAQIKKLAPDLLLIADVCCCEYTDHGHCGELTQCCGHQDVDNDKTLALLQQQSLHLASAGADILAPSGMMDGVIQAIRSTLDTNGYTHLPILSYAVKYASALYGPFREAGNSSPEFGDRRSHQMDFANRDEAFREAELDLKEGADMLMVKPAITYLDIIARLKQNFPGVPLAAYHVSGEYAMIKAAAEKGWIDEQRVMIESLMAIKRAGANMIITYFAKDIASQHS